METTLPGGFVRSQSHLDREKWNGQDIYTSDPDPSSSADMPLERK